MSPRIESLKFRLYTIIGRLEIEKNIIVSILNLTIFEKSLESCESETEVAGAILGAIRRYEVLLNEDKGSNRRYFNQTLNSS